MIKLKTNSVKIIIAVIVLVLISSLVNALQTNGSNLNNDFIITSGKNNELSSTNFKSYLVVGDIAETASSTNFINEIGFIRTAHYLDGEACEINQQCAGGFCCSSVCQSTSCPIEEEPEAEAAAAGAAGGGGGAVPVGKRFSIDVDLIRALIKQGGTYITSFTIENIGTEDLAFEIDYSALSDLMLLSDASFNLTSGESKVIDVTIFAGEEKKPDVYSGNIKIKAGNIKKSLPVIIDVVAKKPLFDINVKVPSQYKNVLKTESVVANITLTNVGDLKPVDVELYYAIRDIEGTDLTFGMETLAVYDKVFRLKELELPNNISFGTYMFYAKVTYGTEEAAAAAVFYVVEVKPATCFDGIQNQEEKGIDCSGPCKPCKFGLTIPWFVIIGIIIIIFAIIIYIVLRKEPEEEKEDRRKKLREIYSFVDSALNRGYRSEHIKIILSSKGLHKDVIDKIHDKVISDKLKVLKKPKTVIQRRIIRTGRVSSRLHKQVVDYISKALNLGYSAHQIEKIFLEAGWPKSEIKNRISWVLRNKPRRLTKKWK